MITIVTVGLIIAQAVGLADMRSCEALVMTSPRDAWRLTVMPDGSARVNYAALPQTLETAQRTFDFLEFYAALAIRVQPNRTADEAGTVECRTAEGQSQRTPLYLDDETFAAQQFQRAWDRAPEPLDAIEKEHVDTLRGMWNRRVRPR